MMLPSDALGPIPKDCAIFLVSRFAVLNPDGLSPEESMRKPRFALQLDPCGEILPY